MSTEMMNFLKKYKKIISSEAIRGMKMKLCRNVRSTPIDNTYHLNKKVHLNYFISVDLEEFGQYGALLHMLFPSIITEICIAQNGAGPINRPVISSHAPRVA